MNQHEIADFKIMRSIMVDYAGDDCHWYSKKGYIPIYRTSDIDPNATWEIATQLTKDYGHEDGSLYWDPNPCITLVIDAVRVPREIPQVLTPRRFYNIKLEITLIPKV